MAYTEFSTVNASKGFQEVFVYVNDVTSGLFINLLLFSLFLIIWLGSYFASKRQGGQGDLGLGFAVAGYVVTGASLLLSIIPNMVNIYTIVVSIALAMVGTLVLYLSKSSE